MSAICREVFQKLPDFVQRCKDEAFEALSDPMYSGKMQVEHGTERCSRAHGVFVSFTDAFICSQVLQKLLRYYLKKRDKVLLFSLSTKVRGL